MISNLVKILWIKIITSMSFQKVMKIMKNKNQLKMERWAMFRNNKVVVTQRVPHLQIYLFNQQNRIHHLMVKWLKIVWKLILYNLKEVVKRSETISFRNKMNAYPPKVLYPRHQICQSKNSNSNSQMINNNNSLFLVYHQIYRLHKEGRHLKEI